MSGLVHISVYKDGWTGALQLSIGDENGGFRLAGPKFNGSSTAVLRCSLTSLREIEELESYCKKARAHVAKRAVSE